MNHNDIKDPCPYTNEAMINWLKGYYNKPLDSPLFSNLSRQELYKKYEQAGKEI
jgi:hypothetical protein